MAGATLQDMTCCVEHGKPVNNQVKKVTEHTKTTRNLSKHPRRFQQHKQAAEASVNVECYL